KLLVAFHRIVPQDALADVDEPGLKFLLLRSQQPLRIPTVAQPPELCGPPTFCVCHIVTPSLLLTDQRVGYLISLAWVATINASFAVIVGSPATKSPRSAKAADRGYQNENKILVSMQITV